MSSIQDNIEQVGDKIDESIDTFIQGVEKSQKGIFNKLLAIVKEVELSKDGSIKQTVRNLRLLTRIRRTVENEILTESYKGRVDKFTKQFPAIASLNNGYFKVIEKSFDPNRELYNEIVKNSITLTRTSLLESGVSENVINPITRIVNDSVTTGSFYSDMVKELELTILGDEERLGGLLRYSKQITTDAMNQFNATYNETIAVDLGLEWFYYSGGKRATSRPFCKKYAGQYFHKKEVEDFGRGIDLDGSALCTGKFCAGRIKGTNKSNILKYRGGYSCRHIYKPTLVDGVPKKVVSRNTEKGYNVISKSDLQSKAILVGPELQRKAESVAKRHGAITTPLNLKSDGSITRKLKDRDIKTPNDIKDAARTTIIADKNKIEDIIKEYQKSEGLVYRIKKQTADKFDGYSGNIINIRTKEGIIGEVQVNTAKMIYAKEEYAKAILGESLYKQIQKEVGLPSGKGHALYEKIRELNLENPMQKIEAAKLKKESIEYYSHFQ